MFLSHISTYANQKAESLANGLLGIVRVCATVPVEQITNGVKTTVNWPLWVSYNVFRSRSGGFNLLKMDPLRSPAINAEHKFASDVASTLDFVSLLVKPMAIEACSKLIADGHLTPDALATVSYAASDLRSPLADGAAKALASDISVDGSVNHVTASAEAAGSEVPADGLPV